MAEHNGISGGSINGYASFWGLFSSGLSSQSRRKTFLRNARQTDELSCGLFLAGAIATIFRLKVLNLAVSDDVRA